MKIKVSRSPRYELKFVKEATPIQGLRVLMHRSTPESQHVHVEVLSQLPRDVHMRFLIPGISEDTKEKLVCRAGKSAKLTLPPMRKVQFEWWPG